MQRPRRIHNKLRFMPAPLYSGEYTLAQRLAIVLRLLRYGILPGGIVRAWHFGGTLAASAPRQWPLLIVDWIAGLSMQDYVRRHFMAEGAGRMD